MSFGFSVGDIIRVIELAKTIYDKCKDAPTQFADVNREVISVQTALEAIQSLYSNAPFSFGKVGPNSKKGLSRILSNCEEVLDQLMLLIQKFSCLGTSLRKIRDFLMLSRDELSDIRSKLHSHLLALDVFAASVMGGSQVRMERKIDELVAEFRLGRRETCILSAKLKQGEDEGFWDILQREIRADGVTIGDIEQHKKEVNRRMKDIVQNGGFKGQQAGSPSGSALDSIGKGKNANKPIGDEVARPGSSDSPKGGTNRKEAPCGYKRTAEENSAQRQEMKLETTLLPEEAEIQANRTASEPDVPNEEDLDTNLIPYEEAIRLAYYRENGLFHEAFELHVLGCPTCRDSLSGPILLQQPCEHGKVLGERLLRRYYSHTRKHAFGPVYQYSAALVNLRDIEKLCAVRVKWGHSFTAETFEPKERRCFACGHSRHEGVPEKCRCTDKERQCYRDKIEWN